MTHKVRTTIRPDVELEVGDAELLDLQRGGLIYEPPAEPEPAGDQDTGKKPRGQAARTKD